MQYIQFIYASFIHINKYHPYKQFLISTGSLAEGYISQSKSCINNSSVPEDGWHYETTWVMMCIIFVSQENQMKTYFIASFVISYTCSC